MSTEVTPKQALKCFTEGQYDLPIAGTPEPLPCPFCGDRAPSIWLESKSGDFIAHAQCSNCGIDGPSASTDRNDPECQLHEYADVALEAARLWNTRARP